MFSIFINHQIVDKKNLKLDLLFKQAFISAINVCNPGGGEGLPYETDGDACRKFWILPQKETIWAWLKLFVTPKEDQSGRGISKFWPLKETA